MSTHPLSTRSSTLEKLLALLALAYSLVMTLRLWAAISLHQEMWPFPALYLLEVMVLPALALLLALLSVTNRSIAYVCMAGALLAFSILGAWSIGLWYLPLVLLLLAATISSWRLSRLHSAVLLGFFFISAALQATLMLAIVRIVV